MSRGPDAGTLLARAILADARRAGCAITVAAADWTRWASATFAGARHELTLAGDAAGGLDAWLAQLPEADLTGRHMLVADLTVAGVTRVGSTTTARIEALTLET